jgi:transposase
MTRELHALAQWLCAAQVTAVAMEATGVCWLSVWNVLEQYGLQLLLIHPERYKAVRGKKTDLKDGTRIAELLQDGRLEGSYVPPVAIRVLRDLTRYRTKLVQYQSAIANRIQKLRVPDLARKLRRYINAYSANARPIQWKYPDPSRRLRTNEFTATVH